MQRAINCFLLLLISALSASATEASDFNKYFKVLPKPQKIEFLKSSPFCFNDLKSMRLVGFKQRPMVGHPLADLPLSDFSGKGSLTLILTDSVGVPSSVEGYILEMSRGQIRISARGEAGLFYGCQTLLQLLEDAKEQQRVIPALKITDYPSVAYRAVHIDLKHHLDSVKYYYQMIDRMARIKVNALIIEFEDKLRYRKAAVVGSSNAISVEEFAAISRYAFDRHIEISPLIQGLGHAAYILKHKEYEKLRENPSSDWAFSPLDPGTYELQFSLYEDAIAATPHGKYLHIGGDEVGDIGMSALSRKSGKKPFELQMYWLNKVCEFALQHNRIPIFWDDMLWKLSGLYKTTYDSEMPVAEVEKLWKENEKQLNESIGLFPKNCVYMRWNYDNPGIPGNLKAINWYKSHGLKVMAATAAQYPWPMLPGNNSNFKPIKDFCRISSQKQLDGILCTAWDDTSPHFETGWRGFYDFASLSWNYQDIKVQDAHADFRQRFYGAAVKDSSFNFQDLMEQSLEFWNTALVDKGDRNNYPKNIDLIELPDPKKQGDWNRNYKGKLAQAQKELVRYGTIKDQLKEAQKVSERGCFSLDLLTQINELQIYSSKLMLLLQKYDESDTKQKKTLASVQVQKYVASFPEIRKQFEKVFSTTRILENPSDYQLDQNHHDHLANGTNNSDWMFVHELAVNAKIKTWLASKILHDM
jgi:hexosaminidase